MDDILETVMRESNHLREHLDCAVRAVAIATDYEYDDVHYAFGVCGRLPRRSTPWHITERVVKLLRFRMVDVTDQFDARTVRTLEREMKHNRGRYLVRVSRHVLPVVDGCVYDGTKGRLHRIVYIYKLVEVSEEFHQADKRNLVYIGKIPAEGEDVTRLYLQMNNRLPSIANDFRCTPFLFKLPPPHTHILLTQDEQGPVFRTFAGDVDGLCTAP